MPPGGGGEHDCTVQVHTTASVDRDDEAPPRSTPPLPAIVPVASEEEKGELEQQPVASIPEDALVEILSRVPYRSLCRFKCVSKPWLALCSSQDIRRRSPQTLSGFLYKPGFGYVQEAAASHDLNFRNLNGRGRPLVDPSLPFLRKIYRHVSVTHVCGGLLLCYCWNSVLEGAHVVCNPATEEWTVLPPAGFPGPDPISFLGFDAAVPSRFVVFAPLPRKVAIYSSETGRWTHVRNKWTTPAIVNHGTDSQVFLNGTMHLPTIDNKIATVDTEGKVWRLIKMPDGFLNCRDVGQSQGRLYAWQVDNCQLYIWVLEDYGTGKWTLKHTVDVLELFGRQSREDDGSYEMFAIHPDCNVIFLTDRRTMTLSYDMDNQKVRVICTEGMYGLPYVPCFAEWPSAGH